MLWIFPCQYISPPQFFFFFWNVVTYATYFFFPFIFISLRLINLQYCSGFCHTLTWISHGFTCISHPNPPSHILSKEKQITSPGWMHETSAWGWCTGNLFYVSWGFLIFFFPLEYSYFTMLVSHSSCFAYYCITSNTGLFIDQHRSGFLSSYICCCFVLFVWKWQILLESPCIMGIPIGQCGCCSKGHIEQQNHWVPISEGFTF